MELLEESWRLRDIDVKFIFTAQHYGTAIYALAIVIALGVSHYIMQPKQRSFFVYDATISCMPRRPYAAVLDTVEHTQWTVQTSGAIHGLHVISAHRRFCDPGHQT